MFTPPTSASSLTAINSSKPSRERSHPKHRRSSRRSTYDEVEFLPGRDRHPRDSYDRSHTRRYYLVPEGRLLEQRGRAPRLPMVEVEPSVDDYQRQYSSDVQRPTIATRLTESPPPIDDDHREQKDTSVSTGDPSGLPPRRGDLRGRRPFDSSGSERFGEDERSPSLGSEGSRRRRRSPSPSGSEDNDRGRRGRRLSRSSSSSSSSTSRGFEVKPTRYDRPSGWSRRRPSSIASDDFDPYAQFDFIPPPVLSVTESSKDDDSDSSSPETEEKAPGREASVATVATAAVASRPSKATLVHSSLYTGTAELGGTHTASLTVLHDPQGRRKSLFRWL